MIQNALLTGSAIAMSVAAIYLFVPRPQGIDTITTATATATVSTDELRGTRQEPVPQLADELETPNSSLEIFKSALIAIDKGDIDLVRSLLENFKIEQIEHEYLTWALATSGNRNVTEQEIRDAQRRLNGWPKQTVMQRNLELAMVRDGVSTLRLAFALGDEAPKSFSAAFQLARSYLLIGNHEKARQLLTPFWHDGILSASDEVLMLDTFGDVLTKGDHQTRYFNMMARSRVKSGELLTTVLNNQNIHAAWVAVIRKHKNAASLMNALSDVDKKTVDYAFMRVEHLTRVGNDDEAISLLSALPTDTVSLINPVAWWDARRILSRHKFEAGDAKAAHEIVAKQTSGDDETQIDAAFHAGWYALQGLNDKALAASHFEKITTLAKGNISKARGYYWLGRASEGEASKQAFAKAAAFVTTFYGQLANAELKQPLSQSIVPPHLSQTNSLQPLKAVELLAATGQKDRARDLYLSLGWDLNDASEIRAVADHARDHGDYYAALKVAKAADWRGIDVGSLTHPLGAISDATALSPENHALAYSIARQESEFNTAAVSKANAKGLLQLLPATAREMARLNKIDFRPERLITDANYNAQLGAAYLGQQLDRFEGSYVLTFAAYNAGPARAKEWIERFGDPRGKSLYEVIDWIEQIPFPETRSYVQRILENYQVYKLQLGQQSSLVHDLVNGRAQL
ncbi:MAG: lytic transglycosylase domain-containing protein [Ahrensia sp.]|nr:lytic transglycosylase domain-containing protein [Ahrensia sp.]